MPDLWNTRILIDFHIDYQGGLIDNYQRARKKTLPFGMQLEKEKNEEENQENIVLKYLFKKEQLTNGKPQTHALISLL